MELSEIMQIAWIYLKALGPAILAITAFSVADDILKLIRKTIGAADLIKKGY